MFFKKALFNVKESGQHLFCTNAFWKNSTWTIKTNFIAFQAVDLKRCSILIFVRGSGISFSTTFCLINVHAIRGSSHWWYSGKKGILENSCSKIQKKLPGDQSHKTILLLVSTDIDITSSTQGCLKQA